MPLQASRVLKTFKYAMYFKSISSYVSVRNFIVNSQPFAVVMGVRKLDPNYAYGFKWLIKKIGPYWFGEFSITLESRGHSVFRMQYVDSSSEAYVGTSFYLEDLAWHNIVAMYDGATMYQYVDGSLNLSMTWGVTRYISTSDLFIGKHGDGALYPHMVYQVIIYSRSLSSSEIQWNYMYPDNPVRNGLVLWLQADPNYVKDIDGDGVLEWIDLSGNNNHGKIYDASLVQLVKPATRILPKARILNILR